MQRKDYFKDHLLSGRAIRSHVRCFGNIQPSHASRDLVFFKLLDLVTGPGALETARVEVTVDHGRVTLDGHSDLGSGATVTPYRSSVLRVEGGAFGE